MIIENKKSCNLTQNKKLDNQLCSLSAFHPAVEYSLNIFFLHFIPLKAMLKEW